MWWQRWCTRHTVMDVLGSFYYSRNIQILKSSSERRDFPMEYVATLFVEPRTRNMIPLKDIKITTLIQKSNCVRLQPLRTRPKNETLAKLVYPYSINIHTKVFVFLLWRVKTNLFSPRSGKQKAATVLDYSMSPYCWWSYNYFAYSDSYAETTKPLTAFVENDDGSYTKSQLAKESEKKPS